MSHVDGHDRFDRLDLHDEAPPTRKSASGAFDPNVFITERQRYLRLERQSWLREFIRETGNVNGFETSRSYPPVDGQGAAPDFIRNPIELRFRAHAFSECTSPAPQNQAHFDRPSRKCRRFFDGAVASTLRISRDGPRWQRLAGLRLMT